MWLGMLCSLWCHRVVDIGAHFPSSFPSIKDNKSLVLSWIMQQDWMNIFPTGFPSAPAAHTPMNICILWWFSWTMSFSLQNLLQHNSPQDLTGSSERMFGHYCFICLTSLFYIIVQERAWTSLSHLLQSSASPEQNFGQWCFLEAETSGSTAYSLAGWTYLLDF